MGRPLDAGDISEAAKRLNVTDSHIRAIIAVEAANSGFLGKYENDPRLPKILFEAHIFSRETTGVYDRSYPRISCPKWNPDLYKGGIAEFDRLQEAIELNEEAAYRSASWGLFQIMGFNHEAAGYRRLLDFIGVQYVSEGLQLQCGISFILAKGLEKNLIAEDWTGFAKVYNGPDYSKNFYDEKLATAYSKYCSSSLDPKDDIKKLQQALSSFGFNLVVDGVMGSRTETALREFQKQKGLTVDGIAGSVTRKALGI